MPSAAPHELRAEHGAAAKPQPPIRKRRRKAQSDAAGQRGPIGLASPGDQRDPETDDRDDTDQRLISSFPRRSFGPAQLYHFAGNHCQFETQRPQCQYPQRSRQQY
jgi:hypothetical protein